MSCSHDLATEEGIFVGITSGATFAAALRISATAKSGANILCMLPDTAERYLSTPLFADISADMTEAELAIFRSTTYGVPRRPEGDAVQRAPTNAFMQIARVSDRVEAGAVMDYVGGCQCGKVRYRAEGPRDRSSVCYCRMCQKASGGPFMAFVRFPAQQVHWSMPPAIFASSNFVERGFCRECGTPLTYRQINGPNISLTLNSLDNPESVQPEMKFSAAAEASWCKTLASLPAIEMDMTDSDGFINNQR